MTEFNSQAGAGEDLIEAVAVVCGPDLSVTLCGGTHYHVGAVALGIPRQSLKDSQEPSASVSVLCVTGHKEDDLARQVAHRFSCRFGCRVSVTAGIHIDGASGEQIKLLLDNCEVVISDIERQMKEFQKSCLQDD